MQSNRRHLVVTEVYKRVPMEVTNSQLTTSFFGHISVNYYFLANPQLTTNFG